MCRLQRRPLAETAGGEQRHRARVTPHLKLQHLGKPEGRHRLGQQLLQQGVDDLLITQGCDCRGVVEVAGHHGSLGLAAAPERIKIRVLQLVEHEKCGARTL